MKDRITGLICKWFNLVTQEEHEFLKQVISRQSRDINILIHEKEFPREAIQIKIVHKLHGDLETAVWFGDA